MGVLSVLCNTMNGQNTAPVFQVPPLSRVECPGYQAANIEFEVNDTNTLATLLVVTATASTGPGIQEVDISFAPIDDGIERAITITPRPGSPVLQSVVTITVRVSDVGVPLPNLFSEVTFTVTFVDVTDPIISTTLPLPNIVENISATAGCKFTVPDYTGLITATDYCGGVTITQSPVAGTELSVAHNDLVTITLTATDDYGNDVSTSFDVTLKDITNPTISTPADKNEDVSSVDCSFTIPDYTSLATTSDNCGTVTKTQSPAIGTVISGHNTTQLITFTADDGNGNTATSSFTITLKDVTNPTISSVSNFNENLSTTDCTFTIPDYTSLATASDNCGTATKTQSPAIGTVISGHNTTQLITLTADDGNGNKATSTFTITLKDVTNPTISSVANFNVDINATDCNFSIPDYTSLAIASDNCGTATITQSPASGTLSNHNTTQVITLTVNDGNGNSVSTAFTITLKDVTDPTITTNGDFNVDNDPGQCGAFVVVSATASDNCTSPITATGVRDDLAILSAIYPVGTTIITWTATDAALNVFTTTQTIIVNDVEAPTFASSFPDLVRNNDPFKCTYETSQLPVPAVSDNCLPFSGVVTVSPEFINVSAGPDHLPSVVTWTAEDNYGNKVTATQNVTVQDLELPVMRTKNIVKYFDANGQIVILPGDIDNGSTDNSTSGISVDTNGNDCFTKYVVDNVLDCNEKGDNTVNLHGQDLYGNQHYQGATVRALDNTPPTFVDAVLPDLAFNTNSGCEWVGVLPIPATADNCSVKSVTYTASGPFVPGSTVVVTWTVTDTAETTLVGDIDGVLAGVHPANTTTMTQNVTVTDAEKPVAIAKVGVVVELDTNGDATITALDIDNGSTDNCGIVASLSLVSASAFTCANVGANVVKLTVEDAAGNKSTVDTVVIVVDNLIPEIASVTAIAANNSVGICGANITVVAPLATDNCTDGTAVGTRSDGKLMTAVYPLGTTIISWNFSDASGNAALAVIQTVDVSDNEAPTITVQDIEVDTNSACIWTGTLGLPLTADNCSVVSLTSDKAADFAYPVGDTDVVWTATDAAGNTATATQTVTVNDSEFPIAKTNSFSVTLDAAGEATITAAQVDNGSSDNCGVDFVKIGNPQADDLTFDCDNVGENTVVLTVTDNNGNVSTANATITVVDATAPALVTKAYTATLSSTGTVSILAADVITSATDICGIKSRVVSPFQFTCANLGANTVTVTVTDNNNNVITGTATVTVVDTTKPTITVTPIIVDTNAGCIWTGTLGLPVTADNCSVVSVTSNRAADFAYPVGTTTVTWTVKDASNNTEIITQDVIVRDTEKPIAKATDITIKLSSLVGAGAATITVAQVNNGSSDNCGIKSVKIGALNLDELTFNCSNVGANTVLLTVTDNSDNVSTANAIVTVVDDVLPVIATVSAITANNTTGKCGADLAVTPSATATDNCTVGTPVGTRSDARALSATYPLGRTTITWNVKDANGNAALPVIQTVDVTDAQVPVITTNGTRTANAIQGQCSAAVAVSATATDNCGVGTPTGVRFFNGSETSDGLRVTDPYPVGTTRITWTVTDVNGNAAVAVIQTVTVTDTQIPVITANGDKFVTADLDRCGALVAVSATATDNCSVGTPNGVRFFNGSLTPDGLLVTAPYAVGTTIIKWNVTDVNTNTAIEVTQKVVVKDIQIPVINGTIVSIDANTDATACAATVNVTAPTATDNCTVGNPVGTRSDNLALTALYPIGTTTITWRVSDIYGNVAVPTTTTVKVKDMVLPTVRTRNIPVQLNVGGFATIVPAQVNDGSTDNCAIASYSLDKISFNCSNVGPNTVTLTVIDIHGNVNSGTAIVTISELVKPIARALSTITLQLDKDGLASVLPADLNNGSTDNCAIFSYSLDKSNFDCSNVGLINIVNLTATDTSGNDSDPVQVKVIVQDKLVPVITAIANLDQTTSLDECGWIPTQVQVPSASVSDNCSMTLVATGTRSDAKALNALYPIGTTIITWKVTDANGNVGLPLTTTVNVKDITGPTVIVNNIELVLIGETVTITDEILLNDILESATDACGVDVHSYSLDRDTFTIVDVLASPVTIYLTVKDIYGNATVKPFEVTFPRVPAVANEVITPNGDGTNDAWVIDNITNHPNSIVKVYNQWGSLVFSAKNYQNNWDGKLNGNDVTLPDGGSYYYQIDLDGNGTVEEQGWLYITRQ